MAESKRSVMMLVTMMIVMVMGNLLVNTEAQPPKPGSALAMCFVGCIKSCIVGKTTDEALWCPLNCILTCHPTIQIPPSPSPSPLSPSPISPSPTPSPLSPTPSPSSDLILVDDIVQDDYFCKLGCATRHCVSISTLPYPEVGKVADCLNSCLDKCSTKY